MIDKEDPQVLRVRDFRAERGRGVWWMERMRKMKTRIAIACTALGIVLASIGLYCYKYSVVETETIPGYATGYWLKYPYLGVGFLLMPLGTALFIIGICYFVVIRIKDMHRSQKDG